MNYARVLCASHQLLSTLRLQNWCSKYVSNGMHRTTVIPDGEKDAWTNFPDGISTFCRVVGMGIQEVHKVLYATLGALSARGATLAAKLSVSRAITSPEAVLRRSWIENRASF